LGSISAKFLEVFVDQSNPCRGFDTPTFTTPTLIKKSVYIIGKKIIKLLCYESKWQLSMEGNAENAMLCKFCPSIITVRYTPSPFTG
jgi:hypothetical protein